jgi:hypothetical protein
VAGHEGKPLAVKLRQPKGTVKMFYTIEYPPARLAAPSAEFRNSSVIMEGSA